MRFCSSSRYGDRSEMATERAPILLPKRPSDTGRDASSLGDTTNFIARVSPDTHVKHGDTVDLVVNTAKLHFFDPSTSERIGVKRRAAATI